MRMIWLDARCTATMPDMTRHRPLLLVICMASLPTTLSAQCMRLVPATAKSRPQIDGPGAWGALNGTVSLECLTYVSYRGGAEPYAILKDERGRTYRVGKGTSVGENSGKIVGIAPNRITIVQIVEGATGGGREIQRYLFRTR